MLTLDESSPEAAHTPPLADVNHNQTGVLTEKVALPLTAIAGARTTLQPTLAAAPGLRVKVRIADGA
jgi:hypothetical protein